jgi:ribosome-binding protein aMBF1 (putative translation factor)
MTQTLELDGRKYIVLPLDEFESLRDAAAVNAINKPVPLPKKRADGSRPASETIRAILAQRIVAARNGAKLTQAALAQLAGMQVATLNRIERAKVMPDTKTVAKIEKVLSAHGQRV